MFGFCCYLRLVFYYHYFSFKIIGLKMRTERTYVCHVTASLMVQWIIFVMPPPDSVNATPVYMGQNVMPAPISLRN